MCRERAAVTVVPGGDTIRRVPSADDRGFGVRSENSEFANDVDIKSALAAGYSDAVCRERTQHLNPLVPGCTLPPLMWEAARQNKQDSFDMPQRRMGQGDMSKSRRVERSRKQSDPCRKSVKSSQELHLSSYESGTFSHNF